MIFQTRALKNSLYCTAQNNTPVSGVHEADVDISSCGETYTQNVFRNNTLGRSQLFVYHSLHPTDPQFM